MLTLCDNVFQTIMILETYAVVHSNFSYLTLQMGQDIAGGRYFERNMKSNPVKATPISKFKVCLSVPNVK